MQSQIRKLVFTIRGSEIVSLRKIHPGKGSLQIGGWAWIGFRFSGKVTVPGTASPQIQSRGMLQRITIRALLGELTTVSYSLYNVSTHTHTHARTQWPNYLPNNGHVCVYT